MKEKHYIKKVLNNNVVFSKNKDGKDIILTGLGLGFQKKKGEVFAFQEFYEPERKKENLLMKIKLSIFLKLKAMISTQNYPHY